MPDLASSELENIKLLCACLVLMRAVVASLHIVFIDGIFNTDNWAVCLCATEQETNKAIVSRKKWGGLRM